MNERSPDLGDLFEAAHNGLLLNIHTHLPAVIETYDPTTQSCSVQIELRQAKFEEDGTRTPMRIPVINSVPVKFEGGGGFRTTFPLQRGDKVWLEFCEGSLDLWKHRGGDVDPADDRRMDLSDAIAVTGLRDLAHPWKNCPPDRMSIGADAGPTIDITTSQVLAGGSDATQAAVGDSALADFISALTAASSALAAGGVATAQAKAAVDAIKTALAALNGGAGWTARTSVVKVK